VVEVELTPGELLIGTIIGAMREYEALKFGKEHKRFPPKDKSHFVPPSMAQHIATTCAEIGVAKHLGRFWSGGLEQGACDVSGHVEVRYTNVDNGHLRVYEEDRDDATYVLVTGMMPKFHIRGWLRGEKAKDAKFWKEPVKGKGFVFWIDQASLNKMPTK
jgi:hypothetical protein